MNNDKSDMVNWGEKRLSEVWRDMKSERDALKTENAALKALLVDIDKYVGKDWYYAPYELQERVKTVLGKSSSY